MIYLVNHRDHYPNDVIDVTSRSATWSKNLSPFFVGPVQLYREFTAKNVENAWQFTKVYSEHVNELGHIKPDYFEWAKKGWNSNFAQRYPMGKGIKPLFSLWDGERLNYISARNKIYIPLYSYAVTKTLAYQKLKKLYQEKGELWLLDFDVYRYDKIGYTFYDVINDETKKCGHGFILAMLLEGYL